LGTRFHERLFYWDGTDVEEFGILEHGLYIVVYLLSASLCFMEVEDFKDGSPQIDRRITSFLFGFVIAMFKARALVVKPLPEEDGKASTACDSVIDERGDRKPLTTWLFETAAKAQVYKSVVLLVTTLLN
jgi:hypothetical protein